MNLSKNKLNPLLGLLLCWHATSALAQKADRDMPLNMEADRVTVDDSNQTSTFGGNVQMRQGSMLIEAGKIVITQDKQGYSQVTASGQPAHFRQKRDGTNEFADGYGERIVYDSYAEIAEFIGRARVQREGDDVRGEHIIYNTRTGIFQVFGAKALDRRLSVDLATLSSSDSLLQWRLAFSFGSLRGNRSQVHLRSRLCPLSTLRTRGRAANLDALVAKNEIAVNTYVAQPSLQTAHPRLVGE